MGRVGHIARDMRGCHLACPPRIGVQYDGLLDPQERVRPHDLAGEGGVLDGHEVRVGTPGALRREPQHLRTESGEHPARGGVGGGAGSGAGRPCVRGGRVHGTARKDLFPGDMVQLVVGIALSTPHHTPDPDQPSRLLDLALDAIHARR